MWLSIQLANHAQNKKKWDSFFFNEFKNMWYDSLVIVKNF